MPAPIAFNGPNGRVIVEVPATQPIVIEVGKQGPVGPPGYGVLVAEAGADLIPGSPVYVTGAATFELAQADAYPQTIFAGMSSKPTLTGFLAEIVAGGPLELSPAQWDAITGQVGGLVPGTVYYLSPTTPGIIQPTPPAAVGTFSVKIGQAITASLMEVDPRNPIKL